MGENGAVLTGERFLVVLPHGNKVPQAGVELLHDGLKSKERRDFLINNGNSSIRINTHKKKIPDLTSMSSEVPVQTYVLSAKNLDEFRF